MVEIKHNDLFKSCSTLNVHTGGITTLMLATRGRGSGSEEIKKINREQEFCARVTEVLSIRALTYLSLTSVLSCRF